LGGPAMHINWRRTGLLATWMALSSACGPGSREACQGIALGTPAAELPLSNEGTLWGHIAEGEPLRGPRMTCCPVPPGSNPSYQCDFDCSDRPPPATAWDVDSPYSGTCYHDGDPYAGHCVAYVNEGKVIATLYHCVRTQDHY
jgi:hypothetical protein